MKSKIVGKVSFDEQLLQQDIAKILAFPDVKEEYSEYRFGTWKNYVLWNGTGRQIDTLFRGMAGGGVKTELGEQLQHINSVIEATFHTHTLKMLRANLLKDALLIPHRDYVEFKVDSTKLARLHVPIKTNNASLHSEDDCVFHMRKGEVWFLNVDSVHSACNQSEDPRISLVLDFGLEDGSLESVFKDPKCYQGELALPMIIEREPLDDNFINAIATMNRLINRENYKDIVQFLSRVHYYKDVNSSFLFDRLIEICREHEDKWLLQKSVKFKSYLIEHREIEERFCL
jgi:hypothetical protein